MLGKKAMEGARNTARVWELEGRGWRGEGAAAGHSSLPQLPCTHLRLTCPNLDPSALSIEAKVCCSRNNRAVPHPHPASVINNTFIEDFACPARCPRLLWTSPFHPLETHERKQVLIPPPLQRHRSTKGADQALSPEPWCFLSSVSCDCRPGPCEPSKLRLGILGLWPSPHSALLGSASTPSSGSLAWLSWAVWAARPLRGPGRVPGWHRGEPVPEELDVALVAD